MENLGPSKRLESVLRVIYDIFGKSDYWLGFGGLWGLIANDGVIPDGDLDLCVLYPYDWQNLVKRFKGNGYRNAKVLLNDVDPTQALYAGFNHQKLPHICVSFWYPHNGIRYFCHDEHHDTVGAAVPKDGYYFKGVPGWAVEDNRAFHMVDWPGISGKTQVRVPIWPGVILDHCYPLWAFRKQRYVPAEYGDIQKPRCASYHRGGAISPYRIHAQSMKDWDNKRAIDKQLLSNRTDYMSRLENLRVRG